MKRQHRVAAVTGQLIRLCHNYTRIAGATPDAGWKFKGHDYIQDPMHELDDQMAPNT